MAAISYHETVKELQDVHWHAASPFARPEWFALLEDAGDAPFIAKASSGDAALALPLVHDGKRLNILSNWYAFTWQGLQTAGKHDDALLTCLARALRERSGQITLHKLPVENGVSQRFARAFRAAGWLVFAHQCDTNHFLAVAGRSFAEVLATKPGALRTTLSRKAKRLEITLATTFSADNWAHYETIYAQSWKPAEGNPSLLRAFAQNEASAGRLRFALARYKGEPVAAQFWSVDHGIAYIHKLAHRENAKQLSAGTVLTAALLEHVIDCDKVREVDFGTGDDAYKRDWMEAVRPRYRLRCLDPARAANWPLIARLSLRALVSKANRS